MATLSLREAAEQTGVSKSTIFRAIKAGRMSAPRDDDGQFQIDPAELFRVYPPKAATEPNLAVSGDVPGHAETHPAGRGAPPSGTDHETALRLATAEAQIEGLKAMVEELRRSRDRWETQAERLVMQLPKPAEPVAGPVVASAPAVERAPITFVPPSWWPFRRSA